LPIDRVLADRRLLGAALDMSTRSTWLTVWKAAYALPLADQEREILGRIAGGRNPPTRRVREVWINAGRRGGKSEEAAAVAVHTALFVKHKLSRGEVGMVLVIAGSRDQAKVVFTFVREFLEASPALRREVKSATQSEVKTANCACKQAAGPR
jgi:phage terminase large subunit-like protein